MEFAKSLYTSRFAALALVSAFLVIEHCQAMALARKAQDADSDHWKGNALQLFLALEQIALKAEDSWYVAMVFVYAVLVAASSLTYVLLAERIHAWNKSNGIAGWVVAAADHIIYDFLYIPILMLYTSSQFCDNYEDLIVAPDVDCWGGPHMAAIQVGLVVVSVAIVMAAAIMPVLKTERQGVESRWGNESYFAGAYKVQLAILVFLVFPIRIPKIGIVVSLAFIAYMAIYECYKELHIASLKIGLLCGQLWVFLCTSVSEEDLETGSNMLAGWPLAIAVGYSFFYVKEWFITREPKELVIEK